MINDQWHKNKNLFYFFYLSLILLFSASGDAVGAGSEPARTLQTVFLQDVRFSASQEKIRFVFDVNALPSVKITRSGNNVVLTLSDTKLLWEKSELALKDNSITKVTVSEDAGKQSTVIEIYITHRMPYRVFKLVNPVRLVVDVYKMFDDTTVLILQSSLEFDAVRKDTGEGLLSYVVLHLDDLNKAFKLKTSLANQMFSREKLSAIMRNAGAFAGINGGFFSKEGKPLGMIAVEGQVLSENLFHRSCLVEKKSGGVSIENADVEVFAEVEGGKTLKISGLNSERKESDITLYLPAFGETTKTNAWGKEYGVVDGVVQETAVTSGNNLTIPQNGFVISAAAKRAEDVMAAGIETGKKVKLAYKLKPDMEFKDILCAGPRLIKDGKIYVTAKEEQFKKDVTNGKAPRTAVGITKDGGIFVVVVDGRNPQISDGFSLHELAELMMELGAYNALNFDGGGSSTMVVGDTVVNSPSDGTERKIATALLFMLNVSGDWNSLNANESEVFSELFLKKGFSMPTFSEAH